MADKQRKNRPQVYAMSQLVLIWALYRAEFLLSLKWKVLSQ